MRADIVPGAVFPDYELPDHTTKRRRLSELQGQDPIVLVLSPALSGGKPYTTTPPSGISDSTVPLRKHWCEDVSEHTLSTSGMTSLLTDKKRSLSKADRAAYTAAYARPGRMRAGWAYFASFGQAAKDFAQLSQIKLSMPALAIGGEQANGELLGQQTRIVASDAGVVVLKDTGHWVLEGNPKETTDALMNFL